MRPVPPARKMQPQFKTNHAAVFPAQPNPEPGSQARRAERGNPSGLGTCLSTLSLARHLARADTRRVTIQLSDPVLCPALLAQPLADPSERLNHGAWQIQVGTRAPGSGPIVAPTHTKRPPHPPPPNRLPLHSAVAFALSPSVQSARSGPRSFVCFISFHSLATKYHALGGDPPPPPPNTHSHTHN
jgi:hypothetical protein